MIGFATVGSSHPHFSRRVVLTKHGRNVLRQRISCYYKPSTAAVTGSEFEDAWHTSRWAPGQNMCSLIVGCIAEGEIFGAMAALTHADRSATVKAKTPCAVVKVPKGQFIRLIKNHAGSIQGLLMDMANSIVSFNEQLVGLQGGRYEHHIGS